MIDTTGCTVILYTQDGCADSKVVRDWLTEQGIPFTERNVSRDVAAANALVATGIFATPLITVCTRKVFGNRPDLITSTIETCDLRRAA